MIPKHNTIIVRKRITAHYIHLPGHRTHIPRPHIPALNLAVLIRKRHDRPEQAPPTLIRRCAVVVHEPQARFGYGGAVGDPGAVVGVPLEAECRRAIGLLQVVADTALARDDGGSGLVQGKAVAGDVVDLLGFVVACAAGGIVGVDDAGWGGGVGAGGDGGEVHVVLSGFVFCEDGGGQSCGGEGDIRGLHGDRVFEL